jgi:hypothetical protein
MGARAAFFLAAKSSGFGAQCLFSLFLWSCNDSKWHPDIIFLAANNSDIVLLI